MKLLGVSCVALATLLALHGCLGCDDIGCTGGFEFTARAAEGAAVPEGTYAVEIVLETSRFATTCTITDMALDSDCGFPERVEGEDFHVDVHLQQLDLEVWDPEQPVGGFDIDASQLVEEKRSSSTRGPRHVEILITRGDEVLVDEAYEIAYEREEDFGGEGCGFCDSNERRDEEFAP